MDKIGVFFFKSGSESSVRFNAIKKISEICGICVSLWSKAAESIREI